jgi:hypothetical protein
MMTREDIEQLTDWLKSPTLPKLVAQIEEKYVAAWKAATKPEDREHCWRMIRCLQGVVEEMVRLTATQKVDHHNASRARANNWNMPKPEERAS